MSSFSKKALLFFLPFVLVVTLFPAGYTWLHARFFMDAPPMVADVIVPAVLAWAPAILFFRRRSKMIVYGGRYKEAFVFQLLIWIATALVSVLAQLYLEGSSGHTTVTSDLLHQLNPVFTDNMVVSLNLVVGACIICISLMLVLLFFISVDEWEYLHYRNGAQSVTEHELNFFFSFFIPRNGYAIVPLMMVLNIAVFSLMAIAGLGFKSFHMADLVRLGGNLRPLVIEGQWWRLFTYMFLHGGAMHLVSNMVGLVFVGARIEPTLKTWRMGLIYIVTGLVAGAASLWWHPQTVSVGASGAIFGLYGAFLALLFAGVFPKDFKRQFLRMTLVFIIYNIGMGFSGNIDNAAHLGGLLTGLLLGFLFSGSLKSGKNETSLQDTQTQNLS